MGKPKYAVKGVSLGIPNGECFGLLGINGAGKSTTLSMLSGAFPPSMGSAHIAGLDLNTHVHTCRRKIGFCPQFDALFDFLTGREHLILYARIKGIAEADICRVVEGKIKEMSLDEYADQVAIIFCEISNFEIVPFVTFCSLHPANPTHLSSMILFICF